MRSTGPRVPLLCDLLDAPTALAACCGFDLCHKYILYLYLYFCVRALAAGLVRPPLTLVFHMRSGLAQTHAHWCHPTNTMAVISRQPMLKVAAPRG